MIKRPFTLAALAAVIAALAGCRTPQPVLDQANNAAALTVSLQAQLAALRATEANIAKARIERIRRINAEIARNDGQVLFDEAGRSAAGTNADKQLASQLLALADSRAKIEQNLASNLAALDTKMAALLQPVSNQDENLASTQKAMATLGDELPLEQRVRVVAEFAGELKKAIDKNRQEDESQPAAAKPAPLQASAATAGNPVN